MPQTAALNRDGNIVTLTLIAADEQEAAELEAALRPMLILAPAGPGRP